MEALAINISLVIHIQRFRVHVPGEYIYMVSGAFAWVRVCVYACTYGWVDGSRYAG